MLDFYGTIALSTVTIVTFNALPVSRLHRLELAIAIGAFIGLSLALSSSGAYANDPRMFPLIGAMLATPLVATALTALASPAARSAMLAVPTPLLVGLNVSRVIGGFFLLLAADGRLGGPFPQFAGWGDVITGALALPVAAIAARGSAGRRWLLGAWNTFGTLDLIVAVTLGVVSANGAPLQLIHAGAGSAAVQALPWSSIPTVLVPAFLIIHGVIFAQLRRSTAGSRDSETRRLASTREAARPAERTV